MENSPPEIIRRLQSQSIGGGQAGRLTCTIICHADFTVRWIRDGRCIDPLSDLGGRCSTLEDHAAGIYSLVIDPVCCEDEGCYRCEAHCCGSEDETESARSTCYLQVEGPRPKSFARSQSVSPRFSSSLSADDRNRQPNNAPYLTLPDHSAAYLDEQRRGWSLARFPGASAGHGFLEDVEEESGEEEEGEDDFEHSDYAEPMHFLLPPPENLNIVCNDDLHICCLVHANNKLNFAWFRNGNPIRLSSRVQMDCERNMLNLTIRNCNLSDQGYYDLKLECGGKRLHGECRVNVCPSNYFDTDHSLLYSDIISVSSHSDDYDDMPTTVTSTRLLSSTTMMSSDSRASSSDRTMNDETPGTVVVMETCSSSSGNNYDGSENHYLPAETVDDSDPPLIIYELTNIFYC